MGGELLRHPQKEDPPSNILRIARRALRSALCPALLAFAAAAAAAAALSRIREGFLGGGCLLLGIRDTFFLLQNKLVTHGRPSLRVVTRNTVTRIPGSQRCRETGLSTLDRQQFCLDMP